VMKQKAVGYILLSFNEAVDINKGLFDEDGVELPCQFINIAHHIEVRFSNVAEMCDALLKARQQKSFKFLITQEEALKAIEDKTLIMSNIVVDQRVDKTFKRRLNSDVYEKFKGSFVKSGKAEFKIDSIDFVENSHINTSLIEKDFNRVKEGKILKKRVNMNDFDAVKEKMLMVAEELKIKPVNIDDFKTVESEIKWECSNGHVFKKGYKGIAQRKNKTAHICPHCKPLKRGEVMKEFVKEFAEKNLLSVNVDSYKNAYTRLTWVCQKDKSHVKELPYSCMLTNTYSCRQCKRKTVKVN